MAKTLETKIIYAQSQKDDKEKQKRKTSNITYTLR